MILRRVGLIITVAIGLLAAPPGADAQQPAKVPRIGMLITLSPEHPEGRAGLDVFRQALREAGVRGRPEHCH